MRPTGWEKRDRWGWRCGVKIGSGPDAHQKTKRFTADSTPKQRLAWREETASALRKKPKTPAREGTLKADIQAYLHLETVKALLSYASRVCELEAWIPALGALPRADITLEDVRTQRETWLLEGFAPKTINHRVRALRHLWHTLDGKRAPTPMDDLKKLAEPSARPQFVSVAKIRHVASRLADKKTRGRFMVLAATGQRPAQLRRAVRTDVNLRRRIWMVRPAKGGTPIPVPLTGDMVAAWKAFIAADAWGAFDGSDYAKQLYAAGWPKDVRPYNAKHTLAITLAESDAEWEDIKAWFGHTDVKTTRIYTGLVAKRLKTTGRKLEGRIGW